MNDQVPTSISRYFIRHACFVGFIVTLLELDGQKFHFWHGIILAALFFSSSRLSESERYKRWEDRNGGWHPSVF
jgi:hypothetical protein